ncbi:hypothetical protein EGU48_10380 [Acinetobacter baumannii]|nr:hypothetical protein EGU06_11115 [Acinetobacter baumannii]RSF69762.1 hypothetical protein EGU09_11120 [Acinetobacter baumannii]RSF84242.1 hypothetical protein EGU11_10795 [Acinetobacter baumannii]RSH20441.1 hypothetical protein EGU48_10380 [Acinetobacter baumannii]
MTQVDIAALSPQVVWQHFQTLCTIPRPSKHEQQLREFLQNWAESRNLLCTRQISQNPYPIRVLPS